MRRTTIMVTVVMIMLPASPEDDSAILSFLGSVLERPAHFDYKLVSPLLALTAISLCTVVTDSHHMFLRQCPQLCPDIDFSSTTVVSQPFACCLRCLADSQKNRNPGGELPVKLQVVLREGPSVDQDLSTFGYDFLVRGSE